MLLPFAEGQYNFWVYLCPFTAGFSARAAVNAMRTAVWNNVVPWGQVHIDDRPLIEQVVEAAEHRDLPSDLLKMLNEIEQINLQEEHKKKKFMEQQYRNLYAKS
jgi:hypothetical protein